MKKYRVGVVGLGMGQGHIRSFQSHPNSDVVAITDVNEDRLKEIGEKFGIKARYTDHSKMLAEEDLDIVGVATPNIFHKPITIEALEAGCHVLCEKPMAMNAQEAEDMLAAAKTADRKLMINFSFRFKPQSWAIKRQVERGRIGDVYMARTLWHRRRGFPGFGGWFGQKDKSGGGPLIDLGVHRLDLALWFMGYPEPTYVLGSTYNHIGKRVSKEEGKKYDVEDLAAAFIKFKNGACLILEASWAANIQQKEHMKTRLFGTKGGALNYNLNGGYDFGTDLYVEEDGCQFDMKLNSKMGIKDAPPTAMHNMVDSLVTGNPNTATGQEGLIVMKLLDAIYKSAETGEPVKIS